MARSDRENRTTEQGAREVARTSEQQPARRAYEPLAFSPGEFFSDPLALMRRMHDEIDKMFAGALGRRAGQSAMGGLGTWLPAIEVTDRDNEVCVCAELPGLRPEE